MAYEITDIEGIGDSYAEKLGVAGITTAENLLEHCCDTKGRGAVAEKTGLRHESPQALLLKDGKVVWHESHGSIRVESLNQAVSA